MSTDHGSVEPIDASELTVPPDELEDWLHGIRTELTDDSSDWLAAMDTGGAPRHDAGEPDEAAGWGVQPDRETRVGRHRAED